MKTLKLVSGVKFQAFYCESVARISSEVRRIRQITLHQKRVRHAIFVVFFIYLLGSLPSPSSLFPGFIDVRQRFGNGLSKNACQLFTRYIRKCYPRFGPLLNDLLRFSGNRHLGGEGKKVRCYRKNIHFKETTRVE